MASIFRSYDIRGKYPAELNSETAKKIGWAFAEFTKRRKKIRKPVLLIGRDIRASSEPLRRALIDGMILAGADCLDIGIATTPEFYFSLETMPGVHGGAMITASHNPAEYNGFKLALKDNVVREIGRKEGLRLIQKLSDTKIAPARAVGALDYRHDAAEQYLKKLKSLVPPFGELAAVIDAAGGSASFLIPQLLKDYPISYKPLFFNPDPRFKLHRPDPLQPEAQKFVKTELERGQYAIGIIFDGDGDRAIFLDERGGMIRNDVIFALIARDEMERKSRPVNAVFELTHGAFLKPFMETYGGTLYTSKVGGVHVRRGMEDHRASLGGETTGHIYHGDLYLIDSALLTMLKFFRLAAEAKSPVSRLASEITQARLEQFAMPISANAGSLLRDIARKHKGHVSSRLDGLTVQYPQWRFNIRPSQTEPLLRVTLEAGSARELNQHIAELKKSLADE